MAADEWVDRHAPFVVDHREIGVADAAVRDGHIDLFVAEWSRAVFKRVSGDFAAVAA